MRRLTGVAFLFAAALSAQQVRIGGTVTDFTVNDLAGKESTFSQLRGPVTVIAFISTQCPISNAFNDRMNSLFREYSAKGVKFLFVNANANEPAPEVASHATRAGFAFPVFKDTGNRVADLFGAMSTPETYVIDARGVLRYHGYIDDSTNEARVKSHGLRAAIDAVLAGKAVAAPETKSFGCTIKRVRRTS
jgi:peroxiredoxin